MAEHESSLAVLVDFENMARPGVKGRGDFDIHLVLNRLADKGRVLVKKAYADWSRYRDARHELQNAGLELIEMPSAREGAKNRADIKMAVDAMELAYSREHLDTFVIVSGDSDFTPLVGKLRELNKRVTGMGNRESASELLIANCDEFIFYDSLAAAARSGLSGGRTLDPLQLLEETLTALQREGTEWPLASVVKDSMRRKNPAFDENETGYSTFSKFLDHAQSQSIVRLQTDPRSGTYRVELTGKASSAAPPSSRRGSSSSAAPAESRASSNGDDDRDARRRRRRRRSESSEPKAEVFEVVIDSVADAAIADIPLDQPISYEDIVLAGPDLLASDERGAIVVSAETSEPESDAPAEAAGETDTDAAAPARRRRRRRSGSDASSTTDATPSDGDGEATPDADAPHEETPAAAETVDAGDEAPAPTASRARRRRRRTAADEASAEAASDEPLTTETVLAAVEPEVATDVSVAPEPDAEATEAPEPDPVAPAAETGPRRGRVPRRRARTATPLTTDEVLAAVEPEAAVEVSVAPEPDAEATAPVEEPPVDAPQETETPAPATTSRRRRRTAAAPATPAEATPAEATPAEATPETADAAKEGEAAEAKPKPAARRTRRTKAQIEADKAAAAEKAPGTDEAPADEATATPKPAARRTRRTKAQIEADKAAAAEKAPGTDEAPADEATATPKPAARRTRRTKAQIEADKAAAAEADEK